MSELLQRAPCAIFSFTDGGIITGHNRALTEYLGYRDEMLTGRKIDEIITFATRIFYQTHFFPLLMLHKKAGEIYMTLVTKDKEEVPVLVNAVRVEAEGGAVNYCACIPLHERKKYEDEILAAKRKAEEALLHNEELLKAKQELEANNEILDRHVEKLETISSEMMQINFLVSHELLEPTRKISIFSRMLVNDSESSLSGDGKAALEKIHNACDRMRHMVSALETFLALDLREESFSRLDLNEILTVCRARILLAWPDVKFEAEIGQLPQIEGNAHQIGELFFALLDNAVKFRSPDRDLRISIDPILVQENVFRSIRNRYRYIDFVKITISDNGIGFSDEHGEYIFNIFKKLNNDKPGIGAGLAVARKIVLNHYGSIRARSVPGKGTDIIILLPLKQPDIRHATPEFSGTSVNWGGEDKR